MKGTAEFLNAAQGTVSLEYITATVSLQWKIEDCMNDLYNV